MTVTRRNISHITRLLSVKGCEELVLYNGLASFLRRFQQHDYRLVVITNQSGLARGLFTEDALRLMHDHLTAELARDGVYIDGIYYCPHHPDGVIPELAIHCTCRKPAPGMLQRAAADLDIDLACSWFVGDILDDVEAGNRAGCQTVLVDLGTASSPDRPLRQPTFVARDTRHALSLIAAAEGIGPSVGIYLPPSWKTWRLRRAL